MGKINGMQASVKEIKREMGHLNAAELSEVCIRLAKYKKENKELLHYLLFHADDPGAYAASIREELEDQFQQLGRQGYQSAKSFRKILTLIGRYSRFTGSKQVEAEFLVWFCKRFLEYADTRSTYKPLTGIFGKQLNRLKGIADALDPDLGHDLGMEIIALNEEGLKRVRHYQNIL